MSTTNPTGAPMLRRISIAFAAALLVAAAVITSTAASAAGALRAQEGEEATAQADETGLPAALLLGGVWEGADIQITVDSVFADESPEALVTSASEVLVGVTLRNTGSAAIPFDAQAFGHDLALRLTLIDSAGDREPVDLLHPGHNAATGADVAWIESGLAARATVGFSVPTDRTTTMQVELSIDGDAVASWDLTSPETGIFWSAPTLPVIHLDDTTAWGEGVTIQPLGLGNLRCGDPSIEPVAQIVAVTFEVTNNTPDLVPWPGPEAPVPAAVAQWSDGGAAELSLVAEDKNLLRRSDATVLLPPFSANDSRLVDPDALPYGIWLNPPDATPLWLDLTAVDSTVGVDPAFCDLGFQGAPVPYAYAPGPSFRIGGEGPFSDPDAQDDTARALLNSVLAGASRFYDSSDETFAGLTQSRLENQVPNVRVSSHNAGTTTPAGTVGTVYWDTDSTNPDYLYLITRSASGKWLCAGAVAGQVPVRAQASSAKVAGTVCFPGAFSD